MIPNILDMKLLEKEADALIAEKVKNGLELSDGKKLDIKNLYIAVKNGLGYPDVIPSISKSYRDDASYVISVVTDWGINDSGAMISNLKELKFSIKNIAVGRQYRATSKDPDVIMTIWV
jgi:hypothetical protein